MLKNVNKIFITGATGFVGSHMARELVYGGYEIHVLVRQTSNRYRLTDIADKLKIHTGDLTDKDGLKAIIKKVKPDGIFHFGVSNMISGIRGSDEELIQGNIVGTMNLIEAAADTDYRFFINSGSFLEYGFKNNPIKESDICQPDELYGITKLASTLYARSVAKNQKKPIITFRIFTPYGPWNEPARLVHKVIARALNNQDIELTSPSVSRDFIYVDDLIDLYIEAASQAGKFAGEIFNAGSGAKTHIGDLVDYIIEKTNSKSTIKWGAFRSVLYDSDMWQADMKKTFHAFSWRPKYDWKRGVDQTIETFKREERLK